MSAHPDLVGSQLDATLCQHTVRLAHLRLYRKGAGHVQAGGPREGGSCSATRCHLTRVLPCWYPPVGNPLMAVLLPRSSCTACFRPYPTQQPSCT